MLNLGAKRIYIGIQETSRNIIEFMMLIVVQLFKNFLHFMEPEIVLPSLVHIPSQMNPSTPYEHTFQY